ncbi:hypothetical protein F4678DRAFT_16186 [Xylaria arbuscula]|nr:hypothetical protein F4678DRAFT_16186 [Xylaria arbuscula]
MALRFNSEVLQAIKKDGYWKSDDADTGERVDHVLIPRIDLQTIEALELFKASTFDNKQNRELIETFSKEPVVVFYRGFGRTKRVHCFRQNVIEVLPDMSMLILGLCSTRAKVTLLKGSHLYQLNATNAPNGVLAIPDEGIEELILAGKITRTEEIFDHGGYVLADGRVGWKVLQGKVAFLGILVPAEAEKWAKMPMPKTEEHVKILTEMEQRMKTICLNFQWQDIA